MAQHARVTILCQPYVNHRVKMLHAGQVLAVKTEATKHTPAYSCRINARLNCGACACLAMTVLRELEIGCILHCLIKLTPALRLGLCKCV